MEKIICYKRESKKTKWVETSRVEGTTDEARAFIYERLTDGLIAKKINNCSYIRSITRVNNYDGTATITEYLDGGLFKTVYTIRAH